MSQFCTAPWVTLVTVEHVDQVEHDIAQQSIKIVKSVKPPIQLATLRRLVMFIANYRKTNNAIVFALPYSISYNVTTGRVVNRASGTCRACQFLCTPGRAKLRLQSAHEGWPWQISTESNTLVTEFQSHWHTATVKRTGKGRWGNPMTLQPISRILPT